MVADIELDRLSLTGLLQPVVDDAAVLLDAEAAAVYLEPEAGAESCAPIISGAAPDVRAVVAAMGLTTATGVAGEALATGRIVVVAGVEARPTGLRPLAAAPIPGSDARPVGALCLFGREPPDLSPRDRRLLDALARQAALGIEIDRALRQLRTDDAFHRLLLDRLPDGVWAADEHGTFTYLSAGSERLLGYPAEELLGMSSRLVMHESSRDAFDEGYRWQVAHPDGEQTYRVNLRHRDGHAVPVELHNIGTPRDGGYGGGLGSVREMTERDRLEREIRSQAAELAAGQERAHLAQELHDSVTQALFSMTITVGAARMLLERGAPGVEAKLDELSTLTRDALAEMRSLIFELRPGSLADEGFVTALRKHVASVQGRTGLAIRLALDPDLPRLPLSIEDALYRIAQESVHNVVKHGRAREIEIRIERVTAGVSMQVRDDGIGFDQGARHDGLGLVGMVARAERLGGSVTVDSSPGHGTCVAVMLPVSAAEGATDPS